MSQSENKYRGATLQSEICNHFNLKMLQQYTPALQKLYSERKPVPNTGILGSLERWLTQALQDLDKLKASEPEISVAGTRGLYKKTALYRLLRQIQMLSAENPARMELEAQVERDFQRIPEDAEFLPGIPMKEALDLYIASMRTCLFSP